MEKDTIKEEKNDTIKEKKNDTNIEEENTDYKINIELSNEKDVKNFDSCLFKLTYLTLDQNYITSKKFIDFTNLRKKLWYFFPGIYLPMVYKKDSGLKLTKSILKEIKKSIKKFMEYIIGRSFLRESELASMFLKSTINDISKALEGFTMPNIKSINKIYINLVDSYNEDLINEYNVDENFKKLEELKNVFEKNLNIFKLISENISSYEKKVKDKKINNSFLDILEIIINVENKKYTESDMTELKKVINDLSKIDESKYYRSFLRKFNFMIYDFEGFSQTFVNIERIKNYYNKVIKKVGKDLEKKITNDEILNDNVSTINEFDARMNEITKDISNTDELIFSLKSLLYFIINILYKYEIPRLKNIKKYRYDKAFLYFKKHRISQLKKEKEFWDNLEKYYAD